jgi:MFS transporter, DHA1 family, solute carrier family 18 (vesicular amine transporter), member 1/2
MLPHPTKALRFRSRPLIVAYITLATFTDLVAYSIAVPVLPDYVTRFDASPTTVGILFGSFGVTLLAVSIPMGAISDRIGRKRPMVLATVILALSTLWFGFADSLPMLFGARMLQGVADGMTWVVGFALIADLYGPEQRGRIMGLVMSATSLGVIVGPSIGGWLYELGGIRFPFLVVSAVAVFNTALFLLTTIETRAHSVGVPMRRVLSHRTILMCAVTAVAGSATVTMLEPVLPLVLNARFGFGPAQIGILFGMAAAASSVLHPVYGRLSDRWGGRRLMLMGLVLAALLLPMMNMAVGWRSAAASMIGLSAVVSLMITPSLTYMAEATSSAGFGSFGVVYGLYNVAWAVGLMVGPMAGGILLQRFGFLALTVVWMVGLLGTAILVRRG